MVTLTLPTIHYEVEPTRQQLVTVVEAQPTVLRLIVLILHQMGCRASPALDAETAMEKLTLDSAEPDLVIADIDLPGMNGIQLTACLRDSLRFQLIPILLIDELPDQPRSCRADAFISKPFEPDDLQYIVRALLSGTSSK